MLGGRTAKSSRRPDFRIGVRFFSGARLAARAKDAASKKNRWSVEYRDNEVKDADTLVKRLHVLPATVAVPQGLREQLTGYAACGSGDTKMVCYLLYSLITSWLPLR